MENSQLCARRHLMSQHFSLSHSNKMFQHPRPSTAESVRLLLWTQEGWSEHQHSSWLDQTFSRGLIRGGSDTRGQNVPIKWAANKQHQRVQRGHRGGCRSGWVMDPRTRGSVRSLGHLPDVERLKEWPYACKPDATQSKTRRSVIFH